MTRKTKQELSDWVDALLEERNKLCARIDELNNPQHKELQNWAKEKQEMETFIENTEEEISCVVGLATIGYEYQHEFTDLQIGSLFKGIEALLTKETM